MAEMCATNTTHLLWLVDERRWCEIRVETNGDYTFKNGRDASAWLMDSDLSVSPPENERG